MQDKINLGEKLAMLDRPFVPGIVGYLNDYKLVVVKVLGEFVWHTHDETDDFLLVLRGQITIQTCTFRRENCSSSRAASNTARRPTRRRRSC